MIPQISILIFALIGIFRYAIPSIDLLLLTWSIFLPRTKNDYTPYQKLLLISSGAYSLIFGTPVGLLLFCTATALFIVNSLLSRPSLQTLRATITWIVILSLIATAEVFLTRYFSTGIAQLQSADFIKLLTSMTIGLGIHAIGGARKKL